jgi:hypothetical protein
MQFGRILQSEINSYSLDLFVSLWFIVRAPRKFLFLWFWESFAVTCLYFDVIVCRRQERLEFLYESGLGVSTGVKTQSSSLYPLHYLSEPLHYLLSHPQRCRSPLLPLAGHTQPRCLPVQFRFLNLGSFPCRRRIPRPSIANFRLPAEDNWPRSRAVRLACGWCSQSIYWPWEQLLVNDMKDSSWPSLSPAAHKVTATCELAGSPDGRDPWTWP